MSVLLKAYRRYLVDFLWIQNLSHQPLKVKDITLVGLMGNLLACKRLGGEERRLKHLVPAPAVRLMKSRVLSRPGVNSLVHKLIAEPKMKGKDKTKKEKKKDKRIIL